MIAFDFDNTLCLNHESHWEPNKRVLNLLKGLLKQRHPVAIVTARMSPDLSPSFGISEFYDKIYSKKYISVEEFVKKYLNDPIDIYYTNGKYKAATLTRLGVSILIDDNEYERAEAEAVGIATLDPENI